MAKKIKITREAFRFFRDINGAVGRHALAGWEYARAEAEMERRGYTVRWEADDYADLADSGCERCEAYAAARRVGDRERMRPWHSHECYTAALCDADGKPVFPYSVVGGVWDPDARYRRYLEAELMAELLAVEAAERAARRAARAAARAHDAAARNYMAL